MKTCTTCGEERPVSDFTKQRSGKFGVGSTCRPCRSAYNKARPKNREREHEVQRRYRERHRERRLARARELRRTNPERTKATFARYREKNREKLNASSRDRMRHIRATQPERDKEACALYYRRNQAKHRESGKRWAERNREKVRLLGTLKQRRRRAKNPEREKALTAEWRARNRDRMQAYAHARRARKLRISATLTVGEWREIKTASLGLCAYCGERRPLTMDHIDALVVGGTHDADNVVAACAKCNQSKGRKPLLLWLVRRAQEKRLTEVAA